MSRRKWLCLDCKIDTGKAYEHYFVKPAVWALATDSNIGMLCVGCLERRIGRLLVKSDFTNSYINNPRFEPKSIRLLERLCRV